MLISGVKVIISDDYISVVIGQSITNTVSSLV